ncbi:hypothetical protein CAFE_27450 [Caprobacter fermentans]|uniref:Sugar ABC transporter substrate-binding protein n=1 Tax=Caproicibacter fermentans TaxID=2576756 RepID=A0A6N8I1N3_9FIRM|nr:ABC transporter substrate-binding protein [Caproicibacter fermentans]MVB12016.1 hypothetical protein [Caproicibacter fermentans]
MQLKRAISVLLASAMIVAMTACSAGGGSSVETGSKSSTANLPAFDSLHLGTDYKNIKANLKFLTHKTDLVNTTFKDYVQQFQKLYPNINITYEGITDYEKEMSNRITTKDWGDICMVPAFITNKADLPTYFIPLGDQKTLANTYNYTNMWMYQGKTYGIASNGNIQGMVYNKKVYQNAGIMTLPKTPDEFLTDLQKIKDFSGGKVVPMYTNFAAQWTMTAWDAYIGINATGSPDYMNITLPHEKNPFSKKKDMTGPYAVYYTLYEATKRHLIEADPTTTDWEGSKPMMNKGQIGTMALGSWAISQVQTAGSNSADIGYMPFPITVNGKQYATVAGDYNYGINVTSSNDNKIAAMLYVKWLVEKSGFAASNGLISTVKDDPLPTILQESFKNVTLLEDTPAKAGEEALYGNINTDSELSLNSNYTHVAKIVEAAEGASESLDGIMDDWNKKWTAAQQKYGALK